MKNFITNGDSIQLVAPVGGVMGGKILAIGKLVGVVVASALEGEQYTFKIRGAFSNLPKATAEAWAIGDMLYLKGDGSELTKTATNNTYAGFAYAAAAAPDVLGSILLK